GAGDKPQASTQALIKDSGSVSADTSWPRASYVTAAVKIPLVKSEAVHREPAQHRIKTVEDSLHTESEPGECPTNPHVDHVCVRISGSSQECLDPVSAPWRRQIEQAKRHACSFKGETSILEVDCIQTRLERSDSAFFEGGVIAREEGTSDRFQPRSLCVI